MTLCYHTSVDLIKKSKLHMRVRCVCLIIIFFGLSGLITGCGEEDITEPEEEMAEPEEEIDEPEEPCMQEGPPTDHLTVTPAQGTVISSTQEFTLTFDTAFGQVIEVTANGISATDTNAGGFSSVWVVLLIFEPGTQGFSVEWTLSNGCVESQAVGPYTVVADED